MLHDSLIYDERLQLVEKKKVEKTAFEESIILSNSDGARITKLASSGRMIRYLYEDAKTQVEVMERGCRLSGNGRCVGWKSSNSEYSWIHYQEFIKRANNFGSGLMNLGAELGQSSFIGIYAQNSTEWLITQHGCYQYSSPIVPLYDSLGPDAFTYMINHGEIKIIICDKEQKVKALLDKKEDMPYLKQIICMSCLSDCVKNLAIKKGVYLHLFENVANDGKLKPTPTNLPQSSDISLICYTSGTTGKPKAAVLTHENVVASVSGMILQMGKVALNKNDIMISYLPLAHIMEQICEVMVFMNGGSVGYFNGDIKSLLDDMKSLQPTFFPAVPRLLNKLFDKAQAQVNYIPQNDALQEEKLEKVNSVAKWNPNLYKSFRESLGGKIKLILTAAAPISDTVLTFYQQAIGCNVVELYGQTETTGPCTTNVVSENSIGNVGPPTACCMIKLEDVPELGYFQRNNTGELCVKGYNVLQSYYKDPEKTAETIDKDGWMHTGDIAMWMPNGTIKIIDRKKHIFKLSQGEYVAPEKLESIYLQSPYISQILIHGDSLQSYLVAIVIPDQDMVMSWCKENSTCLSWTEACKTSVVKRLIFDDMQRIAKTANLVSFEQVKKIHLHSKLLTFEDGQLTPTSKTKREICQNYFSKEIQAMYDDKV